MKTLDIQAKEWFDGINGNSYFSARVTVDFGLDTVEEFKLPYQYGYGEMYLQMTLELLTREGFIPTCPMMALWSWCRDNGVILRTNKEEGCLKRDMKAWGE